MAKSYSQRLPVDRDGTPMLESFPPFPAIQVNMRETGVASSVWALNANTTTVLVTAVGGGAAIRWAANQQTSVFASIGGMSYDATLAPNESRLFVVPRSVMGINNTDTDGNPSIVGLNTSEGLYPGIATRSLGVGSVLLTEY